MKANKKMIQDKMQSMSGKVVLLKDLSNLNSKLKSGTTRNDLEESIKSLRKGKGKGSSLKRLPVLIVDLL